MGNRGISAWLHSLLLPSLLFYAFLTFIMCEESHLCVSYHVSQKKDNCSDIETCNRYTRCPFCFALYSTFNKSKNPIPNYAGCMKGNKCPVENRGKCVLMHAKLNAHTCCCYGDYCNRNVVIEKENLIPKTTTVKPTELRPTPPKSKSIFKSEMLLYYILPPIFGFIIVIAVLHRLWKKHKRAMSRGAPLISNGPPQTPPLQSRPIQFHEIISRGQFGYVWKALYEHKLVAVKIIQLHERASWEAEKNMYSNYKLRHENVLSFHGVEKRCENNVIQYWIITEYHQFGSLADYLTVKILSFDNLMRLALSMISGLVYLHCEDLTASPPKPIIAHRDFKSRNVLVKDNMTCCIGDFGSACAFPKDYKKDEARAQVGTKRYMAPEVLQGAVAFQAEAFLCIDAYALALVLWELLSRCDATEAPVEEYRAPYEEEVGSHPTIDDMRECVVEKKNRPIIKEAWQNDERLVEYCHAIEDCWDDDGDARLTAQCVYERLSLICKEEQLYNVQTVKMDNNFDEERVELYESKTLMASYLNGISLGYLSDQSTEKENLC